MANWSPRKRYNRTVLVCSLCYMSALLTAERYFRVHPGSRAVIAYVSAIVPALLIVGMFAAIGRYLVEERDEYQRLLLVRQSLIASGLALSLATVWGFLESFGLVAHVDAYWIAVVWFIGLGLGACVNKLTIGRTA